MTVYRFANGIKAYIYFLTDNFSNFILSWRASLILSRAIRKETVEEAYIKYGFRSAEVIYNDVFPLLNADLSIENYFINLITDGGPENQGHLNDYLNNPEIRIKKLIALKDIGFSNSPVEALNKIVKYQELHLKNIPDIETLQKTLDTWCPVFNNERPNHKVGYILTPSELYNGKTIDKASIKLRLTQAKIERIKYNRLHSCGVC